MKYIKGLAEKIGKSGKELDSEIERINVIISEVERANLALQKLREAYDDECKKIDSQLVSARSRCRHELTEYRRQVAETEPYTRCLICGLVTSDDDKYCGYDG